MADMKDSNEYKECIKALDELNHARFVLESSRLHTLPGAAEQLGDFKAVLESKLAALKKRLQK